MEPWFEYASVYDDCLSNTVLQELLLEMFSDNMSEASSHARSIKAPAKDFSSPLNEEVEDLEDLEEPVKKVPDTGDKYETQVS